VWQKLNVTAFLSTGIAGAVPQAMGEPYRDAAGRIHSSAEAEKIRIGWPRSRAWMRPAASR
jgi:hypothetical protein